MAVRLITLVALVVILVMTFGPAPAQATVVSADDIRTCGYWTLADILRSVPGFYATYDRSYGCSGVRGFGRPGYEAAEFEQVRTLSDAAFRRGDL